MFLPEWLDEHQELPTLKEMEEIWDIGEAPDEDTAPDEDKAKFIRKVDLLCWYLDQYLPNVVGLDFWGPTIRPFHLMTDKVNIENDNSGKKKVLVTVTSEAFGLLIWANCRDKWIHCCEFKKANRKGVKPPKFNKKDKTTFVYQNKWSNSRTGQVEGGGWHLDALEYLNEAIGKIQTFRSNDEVNNFVAMNYGRELIKAEHNIGPNGKKLNKRAAATEETAEGQATKKRVKIIVIDE